VVLDCGACIGDFGTLFAALVGAGGAVHLFDPVPLHGRYCRNQMAVNPHLAPLLHPVQAAVGAASMSVSGATGDVDRFHQLNLGFHDAIVGMTGNAVLIDQYRRLTKLLALFRRRNLLAPMAIPRFAEEHSAIVDLLEARDATGAAEALFAHARGGRQRMLRDGEWAGAPHENRTD
jgi:hypothetical protein